MLLINQQAFVEFAKILDWLQKTNCNYGVKLTFPVYVNSLSGESNIA